MTMRVNKKVKKHRASKVMQKMHKDRLDIWEWTTLVSTWRYFFGRASIAAHSFPSEIVERFWGGGKNNSYTDEVRKQIARQFVEVDYREGSLDYKKIFNTKSDNSLCGDNMSEYRKVWLFFHAYLHGFAELTVKYNGMTEKLYAFSVFNVWYEKDAFIKNALYPPYINPEYIIKIGTMELEHDKD